MFRPPVAPQRRFHFFHRAAFNPRIAQLHQLLRVSFPSQDGVHDPQPRVAIQIAHHMMQQNVHLLQRLLHVLDLFGSRVDQIAAMAHIAADLADAILRAERPVEQTKRVQLLDPLAILQVRLAARHMTDPARIDQQHLQSRRFDLLMQRNPVHARGLHRHRRDPARLEPLDQFIELFGERREHPHVGISLNHTLGGDTYVMLRGADVDAGGVGMDDLQLGGSGRSGFGRAHGRGWGRCFHLVHGVVGLLVVGLLARLRAIEVCTLPTGIIHPGFWVRGKLRH